MNFIELGRASGTGTDTREIVNFVDIATQLKPVMSGAPTVSLKPNGNVVFRIPYLAGDVPSVFTISCSNSAKAEILKAGITDPNAALAHCVTKYQVQVLKESYSTKPEEIVQYDTPVFKFAVPAVNAVEVNLSSLLAKMTAGVAKSLVG